MKDINLLTEHGVKKSKGYRDPIRGLLIGLIFLVAIGAGAYSGYLYNQTQKNIALYEETQFKMKKYKQVSEMRIELGKVNTAIETLSNVLMKIAQNEIYNSEMLQIMAMAMPTEMTLTTYTISEGGAIELTGEASDSDAVAYFAYKLREKPNFKKVEIKNVSAKSTTTETGVQFSISIEM